MRYYVVMGIEKTHDLGIFGQVVPVDLKWAHGQVGVMPVFDSEDAARKYAGESLKVIAVETETPAENAPRRAAVTGAGGKM